jgi:SAM-dependent methyltransferase
VQKSQGEGRITAAYDALAPAYDSQLASSQWIRKRLWARMDALFPPGARVLDLTAGTGLDAIHLTERGVRVIACDISSGMLAQLRAKNPAIETYVADFNALALEPWPFSLEPCSLDGILSTFAGLNTSADLRPLAEGAARLLHPGGVLLIHMLNRWPALELLRHLGKLRWRELGRGVTSTRRDVNLGGLSVSHYLVSPLSLYRRVFAEHFQLGRVEAQGLLVHLGAEPGTRLNRWERAIAHRPPFHSLGTFFSLELVRK